MGCCKPTLAHGLGAGTKHLGIHSFVSHPEYLQDAADSPESVEFWDLGPELTRPARGLKLWLTLQTLGSQEMGHIIDHGCALAQTAERLLRTWPDWRSSPRPSSPF